MAYVVAAVLVAIVLVRWWRQVALALAVAAVALLLLGAVAAADALGGTHPTPSRCPAGAGDRTAGDG